ncbi:LacI family DNA-binding transcriptional regulator [Hungatella hathewayi]|uniref:LacI family DNA-binding transcriptional regulator n=1 Tax=Hungatella hathewayi TaxID=154046 RepID=UPI0002E11243|nr:LacI family DNA-binding transcriptional regulator [Hungatella hathewayi]
MKIKVKDIAKAAGVSPATVSLVLNDRPSRIADSTKERILRIATEMRFEQDSGMDFSSLRNTRTLGMIIPDAGNPFYHWLAEEVSSCAFENGYVTLQCFVRDDMLCFYQALESLIAKKGGRPCAHSAQNDGQGKCEGHEGGSKKRAPRGAAGPCGLQLFL